MFNRSFRLGDSLDDYCSRCHGIKTHAIVSLAEAQPHRVRCQDCNSEHDFRHAKGGRPKKDPRKSLVQKLLDDMQDTPAASAKPRAGLRRKPVGAE